MKRVSEGLKVKCTEARWMIYKKMHGFRVARGWVLPEIHHLGISDLNGLERLRLTLINTSWDQESFRRLKLRHLTSLNFKGRHPEMN